ncbi:MAG: hypothetical protein ACK5LX_10925, partial [Oscillospiraceae bacterium]
MAEEYPNLPADLPESWGPGDIVSPDGVSAGLSPQHAYNYLMKAVNDVQKYAASLKANKANKEAPTVFDMTMGSGVTTGEQSWYFKTQEKIVYFYISAQKQNGSTFVDGDTIGQLPEGFRPRSPMTTQATISGSNSWI